MTRSTHKGDIGVEICSNCHPFFTGKQKLMDTAGRVERFRRKYAKAAGDGEEVTSLPRIARIIADSRKSSPRSKRGLLLEARSLAMRKA